MVYQDIIFPLFGSYDKAVDINKDGNGKGTVERYNEVVGEDIDDNLAPLIDDLVANNLVPQTAWERFLPYLEDRVGCTLTMGSSVANRRKVLNYIHRLYEIKGTPFCYELLFKRLGFTTVTITEENLVSSFDSAITFDDDDRTFDQNCSKCTHYSIELTGVVTLTSEVMKSLLSIVEFNEPIDCELKAFTVNGDGITNIMIYVEIDSNGDLIFYNEFDPDLVLSIDELGNLIASGPNASQYQIIDGYLIYTM